MDQLVTSAKLLGNAIKRQRRAKQLTQTDAGSSFNIEQSTLSSIERGAEGTRLATLFRVLAALDLEMIVRTKQFAKKTKRAHSESW